MKKAKYRTKVTAIEGYCGHEFDEKLEKFSKELKQKGGYIDGVVTVRAIVIYSEKVMDGDNNVRTNNK